MGSLFVAVTPNNALEDGRSQAWLRTLASAVQRERWNAMKAPLIPPQHRQPSLRQQALFVMLGAILGAIVGAIAWSLTATPTWFWAAVSTCALLGLWSCRERPNVFWFRRDN